MKLAALAHLCQHSLDLNDGQKTAVGPMTRMGNQEKSAFVRFSAILSQMRNSIQGSVGSADSDSTPSELLN
jgi:hypothetical protein